MKRLLFAFAVSLAAGASGGWTQDATGTTGATAPAPEPRVHTIVPPRSSIPSSIPAPMDPSMAELPADARAGQCFARVAAPRPTETYPARVLVTPGRTETRRIPAVYAEEDVEVLVTPERVERIRIPATYRTVLEPVVVQPARIRYERVLPEGRLIQSHDPAVVQLVERRVVDQPARVEERRIPAVYRTERKRRLVTPERTESVSIPAEWRTVEKTREVGPVQLEWREAPCPKALTPDLVRRLQAALNARGYDVGRPDGVLGGRTREALQRFQRDQRLYTGGVTLETLSALSVQP